MNDYHVGFTGTRKGMTEHQKSTLAWFLTAIKQPAAFHHGDCLGSDMSAHWIAMKIKFNVIIHPPDDPKLRAWCQGAFSVLREKPYLERNLDIAHVADRFFATPLGPGLTRGEPFYKTGTWSTIRRALEQCIPTTVIMPDGSYEDFFPWEK